MPWPWLLALVLLVGLAFLGWTYRGSLNAATEAVTGREEAERRLAEVEVLTASKDSLFDELMETTSLIAEIGQSIGAIQSGRPDLALEEELGRPLSNAEARRLILARIDSMRARLAGSEDRMNASLDRIREMAGAQERLKAQLADYEARIMAMTALIEQQQDQLANLGTELTTLRAANQQLMVERDEMAAAQSALEETIVGLQEADNTVYWVAGTKRELLERGVVVEEGKGRVLVFGRGKTLQPARDLPVEAFRALNRMSETVLELPNPGKRYKILTRQPVAYLTPPADREGRVQGTLMINDPEAFWAASPFLILVED